MAQWCIDHQAIALTGRIQFRRPYPRRDWLNDKYWNEYPIRAMHFALKAQRHFEKPATQWDDEDKEFYRKIVTQCQTTT